MRVISVVIVKLIFDFNSATVFGQGNMVLIFHFFGWVTSSALVHLGYIFLIHLAVMLSLLLSI